MSTIETCPSCGHAHACTPAARDTGREAAIAARRAQARERLDAGVAELAARGLSFPLPSAPPGGKP